MLITLAFFLGKERVVRKESINTRMSYGTNRLPTQRQEIGWKSGRKELRVVHSFILDY